MNTGQDFVRKIGPFGCALFLALFVLFLIYCFTAAPADPLKDYEPPHDSEYYAQSGAALEQLQAELESRVFPELNGIVSSEIEGGKLIIAIDGSSFASSRDAILKYYDESLFYFERS
jgi:hypothetical protein